jgi:hypothetical protein
MRRKEMSSFTNSYDHDNNYNRIYDDYNDNEDLIKI